MKMFSWKILAGVGGVSIAIIIGLIIYHVITTQNLKNDVLTCKNDYQDLNTTHTNLKKELSAEKEKAERSANQTKLLAEKDKRIFLLNLQLKEKDNKDENITCDDAFIDTVNYF